MALLQLNQILRLILCLGTPFNCLYFILFWVLNLIYIYFSNALKIFVSSL